MHDVDDAVDTEPRCPACGDLIDYCQGHGPMGDPAGAAVLERHGRGEHEDCHDPAQCRLDEDQYDLPDDGRIRS